jgi:hypothetical protein
LKTCPECGREVRLVWPTCKSCGTLLMARPEPLSSVGAPAQGAVAAGATDAGSGAALPGSPPAPPVAAQPPSEAEQFFAPAVMQPVTYNPPADPRASWSPSGDEARGGMDTGKWILLGGLVLFVIAAIATAYVTFGSAAKNHPAPVVLAPRAPTAGLPTSLDAIVRIEAESSRHTALQAVEQLGGGDIVRLAAMQPNYSWIAGDQPSKDSHTVSVSQYDSVVTIAVSASNKDICAYGRWAVGGTPVYVTMAHEPSCAATTAPADNWSTEAGGAASDLPDDLG